MSIIISSHEEDKKINSIILCATFGGSIILFGPYSHLFLSLLLFGWENSRRFVFQLLVIVKQTAHNSTANKNTDGKQWIAESITRWKKMATTWAHEKKTRSNAKVANISSTAFVQLRNYKWSKHKQLNFVHKELYIAFSFSLFLLH